jgi:DNA-binding response OmpR family regulator
MPRILLVDDDDSYRKMLRLKLVKMGYEVSEACDGKQAVLLFAQIPPDIVLTDLIMPDKEGLETIGELKRSHPDARIIAMSGGGRVSAMDYLKIAKAMGASRVLAKPFADAELTAALCEC